MAGALVQYSSASDVFRLGSKSARIKIGIVEGKVKHRSPSLRFFIDKNQVKNYDIEALKTEILLKVPFAKKVDHALRLYVYDKHFDQFFPITTDWELHDFLLETGEQEYGKLYVTEEKVLYEKYTFGFKLYLDKDDGTLCRKKSELSKNTESDRYSYKTEQKAGSERYTYKVPESRPTSTGTTPTDHSKIREQIFNYEKRTTGGLEKSRSGSDQVRFNLPKQRSSYAGSQSSVSTADSYKQNWLEAHVSKSSSHKIQNEGMTSAYLSDDSSDSRPPAVHYVPVRSALSNTRSMPPAVPKRSSVPAVPLRSTAPAVPLRSRGSTFGSSRTTQESWREDSNKFSYHLPEATGLFSKPISKTTSQSEVKETYSFRLMGEKTKKTPEPTPAPLQTTSTQTSDTKALTDSTSVLMGQSDGKYTYSVPSQKVKDVQIGSNIKRSSYHSTRANSVDRSTQTLLEPVPNQPADKFLYQYKPPTKIDDITGSRTDRLLNWKTELHSSQYQKPPPPQPPPRSVYQSCLWPNSSGVVHKSAWQKEYEDSHIYDTPQPHYSVVQLKQITQQPLGNTKKYANVKWRANLDHSIYDTPRKHSTFEKNKNKESEKKDTIIKRHLPLPKIQIDDLTDLFELAYDLQQQANSLTPSYAVPPSEKVVNHKSESVKQNTTGKQQLLNDLVSASEAETIVSFLV